MTAVDLSNSSWRAQSLHGKKVTNIFFPLFPSKKNFFLLSFSKVQSFTSKILVSNNHNFFSEKSENAIFPTLVGLRHNHRVEILEHGCVDCREMPLSCLCTVYSGVWNQCFVNVWNKTNFNFVQEELWLCTVWINFWLVILF